MLQNNLPRSSYMKKNKFSLYYNPKQKEFFNVSVRFFKTEVGFKKLEENKKSEEEMTCYYYVEANAKNKKFSKKYACLMMV